MGPITLITTGGTIDKVYGFGIGVRDLHVGDPFAPAFLKQQLDASIRIHHWELMRKDSSDITVTDRNAIVQACWESLATKIIITHGTDTILDTAKAIADSRIMEHSLRRCIVLAGALQPAIMKGSDAEFNLGQAVGTCLNTQQGIYIAINGVHPWDQCCKDTETGRFRPISLSGIR